MTICTLESDECAEIADEKTKQKTRVPVWKACFEDEDTRIDKRLCNARGVILCYNNFSKDYHVAGFIPLEEKNCPYVSMKDKNGVARQIQVKYPSREFSIADVVNTHYELPVLEYLKDVTNDTVVKDALADNDFFILENNDNELSQNIDDARKYKKIQGKAFYLVPDNVLHELKAMPEYKKSSAEAHKKKGEKLFAEKLAAEAKKAAENANAAERK